jgi:hypothetical protein
MIDIRSEQVISFAGIRSGISSTRDGMGCGPPGRLMPDNNYTQRQAALWRVF